MGRKSNQKKVRRNQKFIPVNHSPVTTKSAVQMRQTEIFHRSGPLPTPEEFKEYENVMPGAALRIIALAEKEQQHRHTIEEIETRGIIKILSRGQIYGFVIGLFAMFFAGILVYCGQNIYSIVVLLLTLSGMTAVFVMNRKDRISVSGETENNKNNPSQ